MRNINIDYDGTFTSQPEMWNRFAWLMHHAGNNVYCISQRTHNQENMLELCKVLPHFVRVFLTSHNPKKEWAEKRGINIDIWIEDNPAAIFESDNPNKQVPDELQSVLET